MLAAELLLLNADTQHLFALFGLPLCDVGIQAKQTMESEAELTSSTSNTSRLRNACWLLFLSQRTLSVAIYIVYA